MSRSSGDRSSADTFRILVATDNHLGFAEKDPRRCNDSFNTFEEILNHAKELNVDFILLGGDLFHDNKPSRSTMHNCLKLIRRYCLGDEPVQFEFLSDQTENFKHTTFPVVNYEDPNLNVSIPIFSIHGNHDDPAGSGQLSSMDLLSVTGLVNYFGKCLELDDIVVSPLLMQKGRTKLALYGLGSIRDERLHRAFLAHKVKMLRPREHMDDWFNLFVLHQNRARHGPTNYIPEHFLDDFLDLVIWGHEHECLIEPTKTGTKNFYITQPGSSVATSMCAAEAVQKHIGLLEICGKDMRMTRIPLETVRQFYFEDIVLAETSLNLNEGDVTNKVLNYCMAKVQETIERADREHSGNPKQPKLPLIRLRVEYKETNEMFGSHRFAQKFINSVANPKEMVLFQRRRKEVRKDGEKLDDEALQQAMRLENLVMGNFTAVDLVKEYFENADDKNKMVLLTEKTVGEAIQEFVDKEEKEAINELVKYQLRKTQTYLKQRQIVDGDAVEDEIEKFRELRKKSGAEAQEMQEVIKEARKKAMNSRGEDDDDMMSDEEEIQMDEEDEELQPTRGRGSRGRGSRGRRARGNTSQARGNTSSPRARGRRGSGKSTVNTVDSFFSRSSRSSRATGSDDDDVSFLGSKRARTSQRISASGSTRKGISFDDDDDEESLF